MVICLPPIPSILVIFPLSGAGKCFSTKDCNNPLLVETKSDSSSPLSCALYTLAQPPQILIFDTRALPAHRRVILCWARWVHDILGISYLITQPIGQKELTLLVMQRYFFFIFFSASMRSAASVNLCSISTHRSTLTLALGSLFWSSSTLSCLCGLASTIGAGSWPCDTQQIIRQNHFHTSGGSAWICFCTSPHPDSPQWVQNMCRTEPPSWHYY